MRKKQSQPKPTEKGEASLCSDIANLAKSLIRFLLGVGPTRAMRVEQLIRSKPGTKWIRLDEDGYAVYFYSVRGDGMRYLAVLKESLAELGGLNLPALKAQAKSEDSLFRAETGRIVREILGDIVERQLPTAST